MRGSAWGAFIVVTAAISLVAYLGGESDGKKEREPMTQPVVVIPPPPIVDVSSSYTFIGSESGAQSIARKSYKNGGRPLYVSVSARLQRPFGPVAGPANSPIWVLGQLLLGEGGTQQPPVSFDIPLNTTISFPVAAEYAEVKISLTQAFIGSTATPFTGSNDDFSNGIPPTAMVAFGSPLVVTGTISEGYAGRRDGAQVVRQFQQSVNASSSTAAVPLPIPRGAYGVQVFADVPGTSSSWAFAQKSGASLFTPVALPVNFPTPIPVPDTMGQLGNTTDMGIVITNADAASAHNYLVIFDMGM